MYMNVLSNSFILIVNPTIYWAIFCPVVLVNVSTLLHTCIIVSYFFQNVGKDMTLQLPDYGSPLFVKILSSCWAKYEKNMHVLTFINTIGQNIAQWMVGLAIGKTLGKVL